MKIKLLMQSLSPLAVLTIIKNFSFSTANSAGQSLSVQGFVDINMTMIIVDIICALWVLVSIWFYIEFKAFKWTDKKKGYQLRNIKEHEEASLNFYITIIIPLLIDQVDTIHGALTLGLIVLSLCMLLYRTKLFYANPVLTFLGYRFYEFEFLENKDARGVCIGVAGNTVGCESVIEYKKISDNVYYIKRIGK